MILDIIWAGAQHVCGVKVPKNASRRAEHVRVRWLAMYAAKQRGFSLISIGKFFGMHHTNVMHGVAGFEKLGLFELSSELKALEAYIEDPPEHPIEHFVERKAVREKLPKERNGITLHFVIHTLQDDKVVEVDGYIQTGEYESGSLGEVFVKCGKQGGPQALLDSWGLSTSFAIQYGAPIEELLGKFVASHFEPSGAVTGVEGIKRCSSPLDLVSRWLLSKYGKRES
jgi:ribonucleoside-diphosphate reductase alpha chain